MVAKRRRHRSGSFTSGPKKTLERRMSLQIDDKGKLLLISLILYLRYIHIKLLYQDLSIEAAIFFTQNSYFGIFYIVSKKNYPFFCVF